MAHKPLNRELRACFDALCEMCREAAVALDDYVDAHHVGELQHLGAEAALWCRNLDGDLCRTYLKRSSAKNDPDCQVYLKDLLDRADGLTKLADSLRDHKGDYRLIDALELLAECVRLATPPVLRWCHGFRGASADKVIREKQSRFHTLLTNWAAATVAA